MGHGIDGPSGDSPFKGHALTVRGGPGETSEGRSRPPRFRLCATPPSTNSSMPVTKLELLDARKSAAEAISSGRPLPAAGNHDDEVAQLLPRHPFQDGRVDDRVARRARPRGSRLCRSGSCCSRSSGCSSSAATTSRSRPWPRRHGSRTPRWRPGGRASRSAGGSPGRRTPRRTTAPKGGGKVGRRGPLAAGTLPEHHPGQPVHDERGRHALKAENP